MRRKNILLLLFSPTGLFSIAQPELTFEVTSMNFDTVPYSLHGLECVFKFRNTGNQPLIILNAQTSCGCFMCTKRPTEPILPNATEEIRFKYDSQRIGPFSKAATITSNDPKKPVIMVTIKGYVRTAPIASVNTTVMNAGIIKQGQTLSFKMTNYGNAPLKILKVKEIESGTEQQWTGKTIAPGESLSLELQVSKKHSKPFKKQWLVYTNASDKPIELTLNGKACN